MYRWPQSLRQAAAMKEHRGCTLGTQGTLPLPLRLSPSLKGGSYSSVLLSKQVGSFRGFNNNNNKKNRISSGGYLGSRKDEERSEMRYVV